MDSAKREIRHKAVDCKPANSAASCASSWSIQDRCYSPIPHANDVNKYPCHVSTHFSIFSLFLPLRNFSLRATDRDVHILFPLAARAIGQAALVEPTSRFQEYLLNTKTGKPNGFRKSLRIILENFRHVAHERFGFAEWQDKNSIQIPSESLDPNRKSS